MKSIITSLVLVCVFSLTAVAQDDAAQKALADATKRGTPLKVSSVRSDVSISAVLIPPTDVRHIFGGEIAKKYSVVEVNIGNKSPDSALSIQSIFLDYSDWALSGATMRRRERPLGPFGQYQTETEKNQVASNEYRIVRGHLLDAQHDTWRNRVVNWLTFAVSLASGFDFAIKEQGIKTGFGKAGTVGLPALKDAWPDTTIEQLKAIDDLGFRIDANNVPRNGSKIVVCFFPIDRFLTPGFREIYLKSPALFFNPLEMFEDPKSKSLVLKLLGPELRPFYEPLRESMGCYLTIHNNDFNDEVRSAIYDRCLNKFGLIRDTDKYGVESLKFSNENGFKLFSTLDYLNEMSLNNVTVKLDGVMTIDTSAFAAKVETVAYDKVDGCGDDTKACFWTDLTLNNGIRSGTISGSYMTGGSVSIAEASDLKISDIKTITETSTDQVLHFQFKLGAAVANGTKLTFTVVKSQTAQNLTGAQELKSAPKEYVVNYTTADPTIDSEVVVNPGTPATITISGKDLLDSTAAKPQIVNLKSPSNTDYTEVATTSHSATSITLTLPADTQPMGCWSVTVKAGSKEVTKKFVVAPTISTAQISGTGDAKKLTINGTLLDAKDCQTNPTGLQFQLQIGNQLIPLTPDQVTTKTIIIPLKGDAADAVAGTTWHVKFNGVEIQHPAITAAP